MGFGHFVTEAELRKQENRSTMTNIVRQIPGVAIICPTKGFRAGECYAVGIRKGCSTVVYVNGALSIDNDLEKLKIIDFAGVEYYAGGATVPPQYNSRNSGCGVLLLWYRDR